MVKEIASAEWPLKEVCEILDNHNRRGLIEKRILELMSKKLHEKYYLK
jgi:hypothetical protein